jgi:hypothetical protein
MSRYQNDPRWIRAKWAGVCAKTGQPFRKGEEVFYFPSTRSIYAGAAAKEAADRFQAEAADEEFMAGSYEPDTGGNW